MTEFRFEKNKENVSDYLKTTMFGKNPAYKFLLIALIVCLIAVGVSGVIMFAVLNRPEALFLTGAAFILGVIYPLFLHFFLKSLTKKLTKEEPEEKGVTIGISERDILLIKNNTPCGKIEWTDITEICEGKTGFFLTEKEGSVLILGRNSIHSGTYEEAEQIIKAKASQMNTGNKNG